MHRQQMVTVCSVFQHMDDQERQDQTLFSVTLMSLRTKHSECTSAQQPFVIVFLGNSSEVNSISNAQSAENGVWGPRIPSPTSSETASRARN